MTSPDVASRADVRPGLRTRVTFVLVCTLSVQICRQRLRGAGRFAARRLGRSAPADPQAGAVASWAVDLGLDGAFLLNASYSSPSRRPGRTRRREPGERDPDLERRQEAALEATLARAQTRHPRPGPALSTWQSRSGTSASSDAAK